MDRYNSDDIINIGSGIDQSIRNLAQQIADIIGYPDTIEWNTTKLDGTPRKLHDVNRLKAFGWRPRIDLAEGIRTTYQWFVENKDHWPRM